MIFSAIGEDSLRKIRRVLAEEKIEGGESCGIVEVISFLLLWGVGEAAAWGATILGEAAEKPYDIIKYFLFGGVDPVI